MKLAEWQGFAARAAKPRSAARHAGIGMAYYVEKTAGGFEMAHVEVRADGEVHVIAGTQSNGQGHETAYAQLVAERLDVPIEIVKVTSGDSDAIRAGGGTGGSRSLTMAGGAIGVAVKDIVEKGKAHRLATNSKPRPRHRIRRRQIPHRRHRPLDRPLRSRPHRQDASRTSKTSKASPPTASSARVPTPGRTAATSAKSRSTPRPA